MIITYQKNNHLYLIFQDFIDSEKDIYDMISKFPNKTQDIIKNFLIFNFFSNLSKRQHNYINVLSTSIDVLYNIELQYIFHLYILPKDLEIINYEDYEDYDLILKIELLLIRLFKLYTKIINPNKRNIELFSNLDGNNFLQLEANFYLNKLKKIYSYLLNYKLNYKKTIICSDKKVGIEIEDLNIREPNPLKNFQFVKTVYQKDLISFVYSLIYFFKENRLIIFKNTCLIEYNNILQMINRINNLLLKMSFYKTIKNEHIDRKYLQFYFNKYKNKKEIKQNKKIYKVMKSIFLTQLETNIEFFISMNLTKIFEKIIEIKLSLYNENLYIGDENQKKIISKNNCNYNKYLNNINFLLKNFTKLKQYPDFLIKDIIEDKEIYHIIDAKYKLLDETKYEENDIRQILSYAILFNKKYSQKLSNQKNIKKIILFVNKSTIDLKNINAISLNLSNINIFNCKYKGYIENLFESEIKFIGVNIIKQE